MSELTLNDYCSMIVDCEHKTAPIQETGYPSIRTPNIGKGVLLLEGVNRVSEETYKKWTSRAIPQSGDLILAREAPAGNVAIIPKNLKVCLGQRTVLLRPDNRKVNGRYLLFLLLSGPIQGRLLSSSAGATVPHVNMKDIRALKMPVLPHRSFQDKIAGILSAYDDLIENNTRRIKILEQMAQRIYKQWFVDFKFPGHEKTKFVDSPLGKIPQGWRVSSLGKECSIVMGQSPKSEFYNEDGQGIPFHQGVTDFGDNFPIETKWCSIENRIAEDGDILFSVRAPVGRINLANKKIVIGRGLSAIRHRNNQQSFIYYQLKDRFREEDSIGSGTIFNSVTKDDMHRIEILVPNQERIMEYNEKAGFILDEIRALTMQNITLRRTRDLLLPKLINGEIEV